MADGMQSPHTRREQPLGPGARFVSDEYLIIVGPEVLAEPVDSQNVRELANYPVEAVLSTLLGLPGVRHVRGDLTRRLEWLAAWESGDRLIMFEQVETLDDEDHFCGLRLCCDCLVADVLTVWDGLRQEHPGLWLFDTRGWLQTPMSFLAEYSFDPFWRTGDAVALARGIQREGDFTRLPILADALQDAGCDSDDILNHCRDPRLVHVRGCWVVDLVLGKT